MSIVLKGLRWNQTHAYGAWGTVLDYTQPGAIDPQITDTSFRVGYEQGSPPAGFRDEVRISSGLHALNEATDGQHSASITTAQTYLTFTGLEKGMRYIVRVFRYDSGGTLIDTSNEECYYTGADLNAFIWEPSSPTWGSHFGALEDVYRSYSYRHYPNLPEGWTNDADLGPCVTFTTDTSAICLAAWVFKPPYSFAFTYKQHNAPAAIEVAFLADNNIYGGIYEAGQGSAHNNMFEGWLPGWLATYTPPGMPLTGGAIDDAKLTLRYEVAANYSVTVWLDRAWTPTEYDEEGRPHAEAYSDTVQLFSDKTLTAHDFSGRGPMSLWHHFSPQIGGGTVWWGDVRVTNGNPTLTAGGASNLLGVTDNDLGGTSSWFNGWADNVAEAWGGVTAPVNLASAPALDAIWYALPNPEGTYGTDYEGAFRFIIDYETAPGAIKWYKVGDFGGHFAPVRRKAGTTFASLKLIGKQRAGYLKVHVCDGVTKQLISDTLIPGNSTGFVPLGLSGSGYTQNSTFNPVIVNLSGVASAPSLCLRVVGNYDGTPMASASDNPYSMYPSILHAAWVEFDVQDSTAPVITSATVGTPTGLTVPVTITATDAYGVVGYAVTESTDPPAPNLTVWQASSLFSFVSTIPGAKTLYAWAKDDVGNVSPPYGPLYATLVPPDSTPPVTQSNRAAGTYPAGTTITLSEVGTDASEPVVIQYRWGTGAWQTYSAPLTLQTGTLSWYGTDALGNAEAPHTAAYLLDTTAPVTTASPATGVYTTPQTVTLTCDDGTATVRYRLGGSGSYAVYSSPLVNVTGLVEFYATDPAGNAETVKSAAYTINTVEGVTPGLILLDGVSVAETWEDFTPPPPPTVLAAPTLVATPGNGQIVLSHSTVTGATGYNLYWSATPGVTPSSTKITGVSNPYTHTGRTNGQAVYYRASATDGTGEGPLSAEIAATPHAPVTAKKTNWIT